ncbi:cytochrome P450 [Fennellomyces sp. T-0311]|nr:cytochrome P450 [Fennellomyces sp. T-0311]
MLLSSASDQVLEFVNKFSTRFSQREQTGIITAAAVLTSYALYKTFFEAKDTCPVVPYKYPIFGSTKEYTEDPQAFIEKWTAKLGPVYRVHLFGTMNTVVSGRYVREVFLNNQFDFITSITKRFDMHSLAGIPSDSVTGDQSRKVVVNNLTPNLKKFTKRAVQNLIVGLADVLGGELTKPTELEGVYPLVQRMVARASASVFVGEELCKNSELVDIFQHLTLDVGSMLRPKNPLMIFFPSLMSIQMKLLGMFSEKVKSYRRRMAAAIGPEIEKRLQGAKDPNWVRPEDILQDILETVSPGKGVSVIDNCVNWMFALIFASIHTTAENATVVIYKILQHPRLMEELLEEQNEVLERHGLQATEGSDAFTFDIIKEFSKLDSVCREAMRLKNQYYELPHCNVGNNSIVLSNGTVIPPGHDVYINAWFNHHDSSYEDATGDRNEFKPFRFVNAGRPSTKVGDDFLLFGEGKHACPGRWFAIQEIKTIISLLLRDYTVRASEPIVFPTTMMTGTPSGKIIIDKKH